MHFCGSDNMTASLYVGFSEAKYGAIGSKLKRFTRARVFSQICQQQGLIKVGAVQNDLRIQGPKVQETPSSCVYLHVGRDSVPQYKLADLKGSALSLRIQE